MTEPFIPICDGFWVSPQIIAEDLEGAKSMGVSLVINNRPDGEEFGQCSGREIEAAAAALGLSYVAIPVGHAGISGSDLDAFDRALGENDGGGVLAYCRSGTRSTILRALAQARAGRPVAEIIEEAANAGYAIAGQRRMLEAVAPD